MLARSELALEDDAPPLDELDPPDAEELALEEALLTKLEEEELDPPATDEAALEEALLRELKEDELDPPNTDEEALEEILLALPAMLLPPDCDDDPPPLPANPQATLLQVSSLDDMGEAPNAIHSSTV